MAILAQVNSGISVAQVARENGLHPGHTYKDQAKVAELERMVVRLYAVNQFLKKTLETMNGRVEEEKRRFRYRRDTK